MKKELMKTIRSGFLFLFALLIACSLGEAARAQTLPVKIKSYLNENYAGWKFAWAKYGKREFCGADIRRSVVSGYFNADRKMDYAVRFVKGGSGYLLAFVAQGTGYKPFVLENTTAEDIKSRVLGIRRKGEQYPIGGDPPEVVYGRLKTDAPYAVPCSSDAVSYYVYKNGRFD